MRDLIRVQSVQPTQGFRALIEFTNGTKREIDLEPYLHGPVFELLRKNPELFRSMKVDHRMGTITWENGADIDPDVLYGGLKPAWMESSEFVSH
jgi:hypothetical protein